MIRSTNTYVLKAALIICLVFILQFISPMKGFSFQLPLEFAEMNDQCAKNAIDGGEQVYFNCMTFNWFASIESKFDKKMSSRLPEFAFLYEDPENGEAKLINYISTFSLAYNVCSLEQGQWPVPEETYSCFGSMFVEVKNYFHSNLKELIDQKDRENLSLREEIQYESQRPFEMIEGYPMCSEVIGRLEEVRNSSKILAQYDSSFMGDFIKRKVKPVPPPQPRCPSQPNRLERIPAPTIYHPFVTECISANTQVFKLFPDNTSGFVPMVDINEGDLILSHTVGHEELIPNEKTTGGIKSPVYQIIDPVEEDVFYRPCWDSVVGIKQREMVDGEQQIKISVKAKNGSTTPENFRFSPEHIICVSDSSKEPCLIKTEDINSYVTGKKCSDIVDIRYFTNSEGILPLGSRRTLVGWNANSKESRTKDLFLFEDSVGCSAKVNSIKKIVYRDNLSEWYKSRGYSTFRDLQMKDTKTYYIKSEGCYEGRDCWLILVHNKPV